MRKELKDKDVENKLLEILNAPPMSKNTAKITDPIWDSRNSDEPPSAGFQEQLYMVFDVESIGLHGEGFAVGWVVVNWAGQEMDHDIHSCPPLYATGSNASREWVRTNIPPLNHANDLPSEVRDAFWEEWLRWKEKGAVLVADCAWPVEANFLAQCVRDNPTEREWKGPYPLYDLASILLAAGKDPLQKFPRKENELPEHNPLADARQSARILCETLAELRIG